MFVELDVCTRVCMSCMPQLLHVDVLTSFGCRFDSYFFQPTNTRDHSALEAARLSSALKEAQEAVLQRHRENELLLEENRLLRLKLAGRVARDDQDFMDV